MQNQKLKTVRELYEQFVKVKHVRSSSVAPLSRPAHQLCVFTQRSREYPHLFLSEVKCVKNKSTLHSYGATISSAAEAKQNLEGDTPADVTDHLRMCLCGCGNLPELLFCFLFVL